MVEIEKCCLSALEQQVLAGSQGVVQQPNGVANVRGNPGAEFDELSNDRVDVERNTADGNDELVGRHGVVLHRGCERCRIHHVATAEPDASRFVRVRRADSFQGRADLCVASHLLAQQVEGLMPGEDEVRMAAHDQALTRDTATFEHVHLGEEGRKIDDDSVGNDWDHVVIEDPAGNELQLVQMQNAV